MCAVLPKCGINSLTQERVPSGGQANEIAKESITRAVLFQGYNVFLDIMSQNERAYTQKKSQNLKK